MEVDFQKVNLEQLTITLQNDLSTGQNELAVWGEVITICYKESNRAGYKKMFNAKQKELIDEMYNTFVADYTQNVNNLGSGLTPVQDEE